MTDDKTINVENFIENQPLNARQIGIVAACALVALLDGMNMQSMGLAAPAMTSALHIRPQLFGTVLSAALLGLTVGSFLLGPFADRHGAKRVLVGATFFFGFFSFLTAFATSYPVLLTFRLLSGLGLGGAMPCFISLASEYVPTRLRASLVAILWAGFPLGGMLGGVLGAWLIPAAGWPMLFEVEGGITLLVALTLMRLPESLSHMVQVQGNGEKLAASLQRIFPAGGIPARAVFSLSRRAASTVKVSALFAPGQALKTLLLWVCFYLSLMILATNSSWSPLLLKPSGITPAQAALALAGFNFGSLFGSAGAGWLLSRFGSLRILPVSFLGGGLAFAAIGFLAPAIGSVDAAQSIFGVLIGCASSGLIALAATSYPPQIRSTGVGWAMAVGRVGSFCGPLIVGALVGMHWPPANIFLVLGASMAIGAVSIVMHALASRTAA